MIAVVVICLVSLARSGLVHWIRLLSAAASRAVFRSFFYLLLAGLHGLGSQSYLLPPGAVWHSSQEAFQLLELSLDHITGLSHKGSVNHIPLIFGCLGVQWGVYSERFTQSFIEIRGILISFLDYREFWTYWWAFWLLLKVHVEGASR